MSRPRLCAVCFTDATWAIEEQRPFTRIDMDARVHRGATPVRTYYCDDHVPDDPV